MNKFENCPCCNSDDIREIRSDSGKWRIYCAKCQVRTGPEEFRATAHMIWNRRAYGINT